MDASPEDADKALHDALDNAARGEEPSPFGELQFTLPTGPVSLQAKGQRRADFAALVQAHLPRTSYLLTGDLQLDIEWLVHENRRYESDASPDVDNLLKPLIDAMCGPELLIIDDCQIQAIGVSWIDWTRHDEQLRVKFRFNASDWLAKNDLIFVHFGKALCMPFRRSLPSKGLLLMLEAVQRSIGTRDALRAFTGDDYPAQYVMPIQRVFHRTRLQRFPVVELEMFRAELSTV